MRINNDTLESLQKRSELLKRAERLLDGNVACVCINRAESEAEGISYEDGVLTGIYILIFLQFAVKYISFRNRMIKN